MHVVSSTGEIKGNRVPGLSAGWGRLIGSPKLQIIFHKRAIKYRSLLRKMTYKDKGSYESSPPCTCNMHPRVHIFIMYASFTLK